MPGRNPFKQVKNSNQRRYRPPTRGVVVRRNPFKQVKNSNNELLLFSVFGMIACRNPFKQVKNSNLALSAAASAIASIIES